MTQSSPTTTKDMLSKMRDPYSILGVDRKASEADVKKAYRALAKKYHPDQNKGDQRIAEKFKEVSAAYNILGDSDKRRKFDRGLIDENGNERTAGFGGAPGGGGHARHTGDFNFEEAESVFSDFFRFTGGGKRRTASGPTGSRSRGPFGGGGREKGLDINYEMTIGFEEAILGGTRRLALNDGRNLDIKIPAGIKDGQIIRLSGQGGPAVGGSAKGDAILEVHVAKHPFYTRDGNDIMLELPISFDEAVLGGDIEVPTPRGRLTVRVPKNSSSGTRLRLKGKGVQTKKATGHMYVSLKIMAPASRDPKLEEAIKSWTGGNGVELRKKAGLN